MCAVGVRRPYPIPEVGPYDPEANENAHRSYPDLTDVDSLAEAVSGADVVALLTEWDEFRMADPEALGDLVAHNRIVDGRHALNANAYRASGWEYRALGRPADPTTVALAEDSRDVVSTLA